MLGNLQVLSFDVPLFSCSRTTGPRRLSISCAGLCQRLAFHHVGPRFPTPGGFPVVGWSLIWWEVSQVLAYKHFPLKFGGVFHAGVEVPWLMSHSSNRPKLGQGIFQVNYVLVCYCAMSHSDGWSESSATESRGQKVASRLAGECHGMVLRVLSE